MIMTLDCDAIVVGGGLGGAAAALGLAAAGLDVVALDAAPEETDFTRFDGRAYAVALGARRFWDQVGVWPRLADEAQVMVDVMVTDGRVSEGASSLFLHFDHREAEGGVFGWMAEDRHLRPAALAAMDESTRIRRRSGARVHSAAAETGRTIVTLDDGETLAASLVVACDGRESPLRAAAGIRRVAWGYPQNGLVCAVSHERPHQSVAHEYFLPAGPFAILPLKGNRSSLVWTERRDAAERIHALSDAGYLAELRARFGDFLGEIALEGERWTYPLSLSVAHDYVAPRLALAGDAAHAIHPIAGQGLNLGVRDAAALAEVLAEALRQGEDIGDIAVLRRYQQWRRFDSAALALACDGLNRLFSNDIGPVRAIRDLGLAAVNRMPGAKRFFMKAAAGLAGDTPRLMRGESLQSSARRLNLRPIAGPPSGVQHSSPRTVRRKVRHMATSTHNDTRPQTVGSALIIDDHPLFCEALSMTLSAINGVADVRTAETLAAALDALDGEAPPDVILLDLNLPDVSGLDGLIRLKTAAEATPVIVVSSMSDERIVAMALRAGASGFVPKHSQGEVFREALATISAGGVYAPKGFDLGDDAPAPGDEALHRLSSLTLQQARILALVCEGQLNKQIAHELSIAETTVKAHMTAILRKLGVHSRTQAVLIAQQANFSQLLQGDAPNA